MKVDRKNPLHWIYLILFSLNTILAMLLRPLIKVSGPPLIILYGHKLNSNLLSLYLTHQDNGDLLFKFKYVSMDPEYCKQLQIQGIEVVCGIHPRAIWELAKTKVIVSDHGLHCLSILLYFSSVKFADVWHGVPFKGFNKDDFKTQRRFQEIWVTSRLLKDLYINRFGFNQKQVKITGYGRTDLLLQPHTSIPLIKNQLTLPHDSRKVVLFAPTWKQDNNQRSVYPFGASAEAFELMVKQVCEQNDAILLFRTHLNSNQIALESSDPYYFLPHDQHPDTESILAISDIMICDWSSIAFDFLALNRPTIFLDVPHPFAKGFSLGPEYRFGKIVQNLDELQASINTYLQSSEKYQEEFGNTAQRIAIQVYDHTLDGNSGKRYLNQLKKMTAAPN